MNSNLQNIMKEASKYSDNIISNITKILDDNGIKYKMPNNKEITILDNELSNTEISNMIFDNMSIPHAQLSMLIEVVTVDNITYIRQVIQ